MLTNCWFSQVPECSSLICLAKQCTWSKGTRWGQYQNNTREMERMKPLVRSNPLDAICGLMAFPLKGSHPPPAGGPGAAAPRAVAKFHILKLFKVLENESIFQNYQHFFLVTKSIFSKKNFENWTYFTRISQFFEKLFIKFHVFWRDLINPDKFPVNFIIKLRNLSKNSLDRGLLEMRWRFLKFLEKIDWNL